MFFFKIKHKWRNNLSPIVHLGVRLQHLPDSNKFTFLVIIKQQKEVSSSWKMEKCGDFSFWCF